MLRFFLLLMIIVGLNSELFAQNLQRQLAQPLTSRQISGIVIDSTEQSIIGATVTLTSKTDTLRTSTNVDGLFFFKGVISSEFTLSVRNLGYRNYVKVGKYNDSATLLTMDPIVLKGEAQELNEVLVIGTPSIVYKTDTIEYIATDYIVREGSSVDALLKKMEGMEVGIDGSLSYNGVNVPKARLNGKDFIGGDVATMTKSLPADIVAKVQIIDDYGDQAARTGIKEGDPSKLINITTKADKSLGYFAKTAGGIGNNSRYQGNLTGTRINANRNFTLAGNLSNTLNGIASNTFNGLGNLVSPNSFDGESGGTTTRQGAGFTYRDQLNNNTEVNINYSYNLINKNSLNSRISQFFSTNGTTFSNDELNGINKTKAHNFTFELQHDLDSNNFLKITPTLSHTSSLFSGQSSSLLSGLIRQDQNSLNSNSTQTPDYGLAVLYQHFFLEKSRNFSVNLNASHRVNEQDNEQNSNIKYFDQANYSILQDSVINRSIQRDYLTKNYRAAMTYSDPLNSNSTLEFSGTFNHVITSNKTLTNNFNSSGLLEVIDSLSNIFAYSFTQARMAFNYRYRKNRYDISVGVAAIRVFMSGVNSGLTAPKRRENFNFMPILRFNYLWSSKHQLIVNYSSTAVVPSFEQLQPAREVSNPQNSVIGNPNLDISFNHIITSTYRNYFPNSRWGINAGLNSTFYNNKVISNIKQITDAYNSLKYETRYLNIDGTYRTSGNYTLTKQLAERKYSFTLAGNIDYLHNIGMSNNFKNILNQWTFIEKLGLRINPVEKFEINPSISFTNSNSKNSLSTAYNSKINILSLNVDGLNYFSQSWIIGYSVNKNFVNGINSNISNNPLVVNTFLEKEFFKIKVIKLRLQVFDIFNQNTFISRYITETSITDTRTNSLSRYFMISLSGNFQRWKGTPTRNGEIMQRRGDGSFIYN